MKHFLLFMICIFFSLSAQNIHKENADARGDLKRWNNSHRYSKEHAKLLQHDSNQFSLSQNLAPDSPPQLPFLGNENPKSRVLNNSLFSQSSMYVIDTIIVLGIYDSTSIDWTFDSVKYFYAYDANGNQLSELHESWGNKQLLSRGRNSYTFDANGNLLSFLAEYFSNDQWWNSYRIYFTYDSNGHLISELYEYSSNNQWEIEFRFTYTYDETGNQLSCLIENWSNNQWENSQRLTYTYNANGNQLTELNEYWSNNQWVNNERRLYTYDESGNQLSNLWERWLNDQWTGNFRYTFSYDANGNQLSGLTEIWWNNQWKNELRSTFTYETNMNLLSLIYESWSNNQWVNSEQQLYTYDANRNQLSELRQNWSNNQWEDQVRFMYKYFQSNLIAEAIGEYWNGLSWDPFPVVWRLNAIFHGGYKVNISYKLIVTDVNKDDAITIKEFSLSQNYPNPFNPSTVISYQLPVSSKVSLKIYDLLGREVATLVNEEQSAGRHNYELGIRNYDLASGIYFYKLQANNFIETKKMLVIK